MNTINFSDNSTSIIQLEKLENKDIININYLDKLSQKELNSDFEVLVNLNEKKYDKSKQILLKDFDNIIIFKNNDMSNNVKIIKIRYDDFVSSLENDKYQLISFNIKSEADNEESKKDQVQKFNEIKMNLQTKDIVMVIQIN